MWTILNIIGKIFEILFSPFRSMNPWVGMIMISLLTGLFMLLIFRYTSNQKGIRRTKDRIKAHLLEMRLYKDSLGASLKAQGNILRANTRYIAYSARPMLVMIIPLILILIQLNFWFAYDSLDVGESALLKIGLRPDYSPLEIDLSLKPSEAFTQETPPLRIEEENEIDFRLSFQQPGPHVLEIAVGSGTFTKRVDVAGKPLSRISPRRVPQRPLEQLLFPVEPPLGKNSPVQSIEILYPPKHLSILGFNLHWLIAFFVLSIVFGFALKGVFGVEI